MNRFSLDQLTARDGSFGVVHKRTGSHVTVQVAESVLPSWFVLSNRLERFGSELV